MKSRPILFSAPMVRALLNGSKTQTRRIVKPQPVANGHSFNKSTGEISCRCDYLPPDCLLCGEDHGQPFLDGAEIRCPYGKPGDQLWVRETWAAPIECNSFAPSRLNHNVPMWYEADGTKRFVTNAGHGPGKWRPSIHMPRWASRITLEITSVRVERVQEISEGDAMAEGVEPCPIEGWRNYLWHGDPEARDRSVNAWPHQFSNYLEAKGSYSSLWESINGPGSWDANPWVWCLAFRRVEK